MDKKNRNLVPNKQRTDNTSTNLPELNKDLSNNTRFAEPTPNFSSTKASKDNGPRAIPVGLSESRKSRRRRNAANNINGTTGQIMEY